VPFTVPNAVDAPTYPQQARLDSRDLDILAAADAQTGVLSGCAVTAQGTPNMTVAVAVGIVTIAGALIAVTAANSGTFSAANATNPRVDLLTVDAAGVLQIVTGTAAATPTIPTIPAARVALARIDIPANATTITTGQIVDKRVFLLGATVSPESYGAVGDCKYVTDGAMTSASAVLTSAIGPFSAGQVGKVACVKGAGAAGATLLTTVASYQSPTQVTLSATAGTTVSGAEAAVGTDDQTALQNALNGLNAGQTLLLTAGKSYLHSSYLTMSVANSGLDGNLSGTLIGVTENACALKVNAANIRVVDLLIFLPGTSVRVGNLEASSLYVNQVSGFYGSRITVQTGTFGLIGATDFEVLDVVVRSTLADGVHMTNGCKNGKVVRPTVIKPGDDGVAVVSYTTDATICSNIEIRSPRIWGQTFGRGATCVGGTDITFTDIQVYGSYGAGVYFAQENSAWVTYPITRVRALGGRLSFSNRDASVDHGAVMIFGEATSGLLSGVEVSDMIIEDTRVGATENIRFNLLNGSTMSNSIIDRIQIKGQGPSYDWKTSGWPAGVTATNIDTTQKNYSPILVTTDLTTTSTTPVQLGAIGWGINTIGTYLLELEGVYQSSLTTTGPRFGVTGNVSTVTTVVCTVDQFISTTADTATVVGWATNGGVNPGTANTSFPIRIRAYVTVTVIPASATLQFSWNEAAASTGRLMAGSSAKMTRLA
jgi:hypothetical protein